jgi:hypothetical protein
MIRAAGKARDVTVRVENPATWLREVLDGAVTWPLNLIHPNLFHLRWRQGRENHANRGLSYMGLRREDLHIQALYPPPQYRIETANGQASAGTAHSLVSAPLAF